MKSFEFPKSSQPHETLFQGTYNFLQSVESYYSQQLQQTSRKVTTGDKTRHMTLSNFKDRPDITRLAMSKEEKKKEKDVPPTLENKILQAIGNAEKFLQQTDEDLKAKKSGAPKPAGTTTTLSMESSKRTESVGSLGKKPEPTKTSVVAGKQPIGTKGRTSSLKPGERSQDVKKTGQVGPSTLKTGTASTGSAKNLMAKKDVNIPKPGSKAVETNWSKNVTGVNRVVVVENVEEDKREEEKVSDKVSEIIARSVRGEDKIDESQKKTEEVDNGVRVSRFGAMQTELVTKDHIKEYIEAKKSLKKKCDNLKSNANYYQEREKKAKNRFMMKLTGHLRCIEDIVRREHYEAEHGADDNEEDGEPKKRAEFCELSYQDEDFPIIDGEIEKTLQAAPKVIESLRSQMLVSNEDFRHAIETRSVFEDDDENPDIVDRLLQRFRSWNLIQLIREKRKFLNEKVKPMLKNPDLDYARNAAARVWREINYFSPIEKNLETTAEKGLKQITWMTWAFADKPNKSEILWKKSSVQGQKSLLRDEVEGEGVLEMEYLSYENALLTALSNYITEKYPVSATSKVIPNIKGANLGEFLRLMRLISIITKGDCRTFPLYMVQTEC